MTLQDTLNRASILNGRLQQASQSLQDNLSSLRQVERDLSSTNHQIDVQQEAINNMKVLTDRISSQHIKQVEAFVTSCLQTVFFDRDFSLVIHTSDKRNNRYAELSIKEGPNEYPIQSSLMAGGVLTVVGWSLQLYEINHLHKAPIIFTDEQLSAISSEYRPTFFEWLNRLADKKKLIVLLVTHDQDLIQFANRVYLVNSGVITESKIRGDSNA